MFRIQIFIYIYINIKVGWRVRGLSEKVAKADKPATTLYYIYKIYSSYNIEVKCPKYGVTEISPQKMLPTKGKPSDHTCIYTYTYIYVYICIY